MTMPGETAVFPCMQMYDGTRYYAKGKVFLISYLLYIYL